jgi:uncharacterized protein (DUF4415 family)
MPKHPNPELIDADNPEWTAEDLARARPVSEVLPELFSARTAQALLKPRGRPPAARVKKCITIRLDPDVLAAFRATLQDFINAYNFARRLKKLKGLTPYEYICKCWTSEPDRFIIDPIHRMPGP